MAISAPVIVLMLPMSSKQKKGVKGGKGIKRGYLTFFKVLEEI